jgi:predicted Zn-dependent peptidase
MVRHALLLPLVLALGAAPAAAAEPAINIEYERYTLPNGLEVILHRDPAAPIVAANVWYHVGSGDETPGKSGFAHLFEHMMFQGAKHIGKDVHFKILQEIGGTGINGTTNSDRTNYFEVVPSHQVETALWLESDRMGYLLDLLDEQSLKNQQDVVRNERRQRYDNVPYGRDRFAVAEALYPEGHPYRYLTIGRHEDLEGANVEDVKGFFRQWYVPSNATLTLAGDFQIDQAKALVQKWFGGFPQIARPARPKVTQPELKATVRREIDDPFARLQRIHYAWHTPPIFSDADFELDVVASVLGSYGWGRLYKALVLDERSAQSVAVYNAGAQHSSVFHIIVDLKPGQDPVRAEQVIARELDKIRKEPVSDAELRRVLIGTESSFVWGLEDLMGRVERLQSFNHYTGDPGYAETYLKRLRALTPAKVLATAADLLGKPRAEIVTKPAAPAPGKGAPKGPGDVAKPAAKPAPEKPAAK